MKMVLECVISKLFMIKTGKLIYDRKTIKKAMDKLYGLEVCKFIMDMDNDFLILSEEIRENLLGIKNFSIRR